METSEVTTKGRPHAVLSTFDCLKRLAEREKAMDKHQDYDEWREERLTAIQEALHRITVREDSERLAGGDILKRLSKTRRLSAKDRKKLEEIVTTIKALNAETDKIREEYAHILWESAGRGCETAKNFLRSLHTQAVLLGRTPTPDEARDLERLSKLTKE